MNENELKGVLKFLKSAEELKNTLRSGRTSNGRIESTAEHTWRLCLMVLIFEDYYPNLDIQKLIEICIVHDLGEAINGDIPAVEQVPDSNKGIEERKDLLDLIAPLPTATRKKISDLWDEYDNASSEEAIVAKALDKIETLIQHTQGRNPEDFNYKFNLSYGKDYTQKDALASMLRDLVDRETEKLTRENKTI
jgi:putative hydrolase of HD superfamily